jgi:demethylmenaquinone methyltransferase/2-methoxy-6-polyprenyl-1,4-benzoquinol methylase
LLGKAYDFYSFRLLPRIGSIVSGDKTGTYRYLPASIRAFQDPESLKRLMQETGFQEAAYRRLSGGIVAIHLGRRPLA